MKRPVLSAAIFLIIGVIIGYYLPFIIILFIFIIPVVYLYFLMKHKKRLITYILIIIIGFSYIYLLEIKYYSNLSITNYNDSGTFMVIGEIVEDLSSLQGDKIYLKPYYVGNIKVKYGLVQLNKNYLPSELNNGDIIKVRIKLKSPEKQKNPGGFSYYKYLKEKGIWSIGYINGDVKVIGRVSHPIKELIISLKHKFIYIFDQSMVSPYNEVMKAIILGERDNLPVQWEEYFSLSGANHLLAISGLHVGFIMLIFISITGLLNIPEGLRNFIITTLIIVYIILTGIRPSVLRAGLLVVLFLWAPYFNRKGDLFNLLGFSVIVNIIINPYDIFTPGFQLTYIVLIMIVIWYKILIKYLPAPLALSMAAQFGSVPIIAYYFNIITPIGIITNIWAIPLVGLIVILAIPGSILGLIHPVFSLIVNKIVYYFLYLLFEGTKIMAYFPFGNHYVASPSPFILIILYLFLLIIPYLLHKRVVPVNLRKARQRLYFSSTILVLLVFLNIILPVFQDELEIIFFSVGQGDSILINLPGSKHVLVDGGGLSGINSNKGETVLLPYLRKYGIENLDIIFVSHFDTDHALGIAGILGHIRSRLLILPYNYDESNYLAKKIINLAKRKNIPIKYVRSGEDIFIGKTIFQVFNPPVGSTGLSDNDNSIVLKISYLNFDLLLTGDLEKEGEYRLISSDYDLESEVIKLGHHGSDGSSSFSFLKLVSPKEAVISVGRNNYGHPSPNVINRVKRIGARTWRTDLHGAIIIKTNGYKYSIRGYLY